MLFLKKNKAYVGLIIFLVGCATSYAPDNWLPNTNQIQIEAYGGWITLYLKNDSTNHYNPEATRGEMISTDSNSVYLFTTSGELVEVDKATIALVILEIDEKNTGTYTAITVIGALSTISHGYYSAITLPAWLIIGVSTASGESMRDRYEKENPDEECWNEIQKFARFPQGIPTGLDLSELQPRSVKYFKK